MAWCVTGHSAIGVSHIASGVECQDYNGHFTLPGGVAVIAAADGAGSASHSALGARCAVETVLEHLRAGLPSPASRTAGSLEALLRTAFASVHEALLSLAATKAPDFGCLPDAALRQLHTTLTVAVLTSEFAATAQVGDGAAVLYRVGETFTVLTESDNGEYINETSFINQPDYATTARFAVTPAADALGCAVMTDGMKLLAINYTTNAASPAFFGPLFRHASQPDFASALAAFLASPRVCEKTDDDKTLVLAVRL